VSSEIQIRPLISIEEQAMGRAVFDHTWAMDAGTEITSNLLLVNKSCHCLRFNFKNKLHQNEN
jgi:hypothetical protein